MIQMTAYGKGKETKVLFVISNDTAWNLIRPDGYVLACGMNETTRSMGER